MTRSDDERLLDIREACEELAGFVALGRERFDSNRAIALLSR